MKHFAVACVILCASAAEAQECGRVYVQNDCTRSLRIVVEYAPRDDEWIPAGWYEFAADESAWLRVGGEALCHRTDHSIYFYAESLDGTTVWGGDDSEIEFNGSTISLRKAAAVRHRGGTLIRTRCDPPAPAGGGMIE